ARRRRSREGMRLRSPPRHVCELWNRRMQTKRPEQPKAREMCARETVALKRTTTARPRRAAVPGGVDLECLPGKISRANARAEANRPESRRVSRAASQTSKAQCSSRRLFYRLGSLKT